MAISTNTIKTRVQLKSDTEENWNKAGPKGQSAGFVPLLGELIVYTADDAHPFSRLKIGDGNTNVIDLPFIDAGTIDGEELPEDKIALYQNIDLFPTTGEENKLYIDLAKQRIYCWTDSGGYSQLSNFSFTVSKTLASYITEWSVGATTDIQLQDGTLIASNGILPTLNYYNQQVVSDIIRGES